MQSGPRLSSKRAQRTLLRLGCAEKRNGGKHRVLLAPNGARLSCALSHPEVPRNLVWDFCRMAGIDWDAFQREY